MEGRILINKQTDNHSFQKNDTGNNSERREQRGGQQKHRYNQKDCTCPACGYTTRKLHKLLNSMHTGDPKICLLRGPKHLNDKEDREIVNQ